MTSTAIVCIGTPALCLFGCFRSGYLGETTIDMRSKDVTKFSEPYTKNFGLFSYYSYLEHDTSRVCMRVWYHILCCNANMVFRLSQSNSSDSKQSELALSFPTFFIFVILHCRTPTAQTTAYFIILCAQNESFHCGCDWWYHWSSCEW